VVLATGGGVRPRTRRRRLGRRGKRVATTPFNEEVQMIRSLSRGTRGALALTGLSLAAIFAGPSGALDRSESARVPARARKAPAPAYGAFRPTFEENLGQAPADVRFLSRMAGGTVMLEPTRMTTMVEIREARPTGDPEAALLAGPRGEVGVRRHPVAMTIVGADARAACVPGATARTVTNLYLGSDPACWRSGIRNVASVRFDGVYRGIDVDYRAASRGGIEYDFHVAPGADPAAIELRLEGADSVAIDPHANLEIAAGPARIRHGAPVA
jgi:hypothetical protein